MSRIGYVRVSTAEQNTARQETIMSELGAEEVYIDRMSGASKERPALTEMMRYVRKGDTVVVESISRFARSTKDLLDLVDQLTQKQVAFESQKENIDTNTPQGRFMLTVFGAMAELERTHGRQRQAEGIALAKERGAYKGRKRIEVDEAKFTDEYRLWKNGDTAPRFIMKKFGLTSATFWRRVKEYEEKHGIAKSDDAKGTNAGQS